MGNAQPTDLKNISNDEKLLFELTAEGNMDARSQLVLNYLPLVNSCVKVHLGKGVSYDDLYQEGCYGLIIAVDQFELSRDSKFSNYAYNYIQKYIKRALIEQNPSYPGKYNETLYYDLKRYIETSEYFLSEHGRRPTDEEISKILDMAPLRFRRMKLCVQSFLSQQNNIEYSTLETSSQGSYYDRPTEDEVMQNMDISGYNARLTDREEGVLRRRLGYTESGRPETWAQISAEMGLSVNTLERAFLTGIKKIERSLTK